MKAILALEDGTIYEGSTIGATGTATGELCFNTAVAGYQELITDPATRGLIPVMTYPLIGNYGICAEDNESTRPQANALVVTELARLHSNWRANTDMGSWMQQFNLVGIEGVDCRAVATHLRDKGTMRACVTTELSADDAVAAAQAAPKLAGTDPLSYVSADDTAALQERDLRGWKLPNKTAGDMTNYTELPPVIGKIAVLNFGIKFSTIATLRQHGYECDILPATTAADAILTGKEYKAVFLSDGAGDPAALCPEVLANIKTIACSGMPVFGTGMGHLALAKAFGAETRQLPFGHHGANHPVKDERIGHVLITSQNENFTVVTESLPPVLEVIQTNMNDNTVAALRHKELPVFTVQYQPADIAGPKGYDSYFTEITKMIQA